MQAPTVLVLEASSEQNELENILLGHAFQVVTLLAEELDLNVIRDNIQPDIIIINSVKVTTHTVQLIIDINQVYTRPTILFSDDPDTKSVNKVIKAGISAYIVSGLESKRIKPIIDIAIARFKEQQNLKTELAKTKSKLEERKLIDRAKGLLIKTRGFSEDEAYHTLRKLAMEREIAIGEMAKNVLAMAELLAG